MSFKKNNPGCLCCRSTGNSQPPYQCFRCQTNTRGNQVQVVLYGVTSGSLPVPACSAGECVGFNGTYILDYPQADGCAAVWYSTGAGGSICWLKQIDFFPGSPSTFGDWTIQFDVQGPFGNVVNYSPSLGASSIDCSAWSSENAPYYISFASNCGYTTSNCTLSSVST